MRRWSWLLRGYYGPEAEWPKVPGDLAIEVGGHTREALAMDLAALESRVDIGEIEGPFEAPS